MNHDHAAAEALLRTGVLVPVRVVEEVVTPGPDEGEFWLRLNISFDDDEIPEEDRADVVEWGAFGFLLSSERCRSTMRGHAGLRKPTTATTTSSALAISWNALATATVNCTSTPTYCAAVG